MLDNAEWEARRCSRDSMATRMSGFGSNDGEDKATKGMPRYGDGDDGDEHHL